MKLGLDAIRKITQGAMQILPNNDGIAFFRFNEEQLEFYRTKRDQYYKKAIASAGIKLIFQTDSKELFLRAFVKPTSRSYFSFDVFVNGTPIGNIDNFSNINFPKYYQKFNFPQDKEVEKGFSLGEGMKTVAIHLPWNCQTVLKELTLDDGSVFMPVQAKRRILFAGDSITQGFDALRPSRRYPAQLCNALEAEEWNLAIGGERFHIPFAEIKTDLHPDLIVIAYGTNDWRNEAVEHFQTHCKGLFTAFRNHYPDAKIFAITPIWRPNYQEKTAFASFFDVEEYIRSVCNQLNNITVVRGFDLIPHDVNWYGDGVLHPNNEGFDHYFKNLYTAIKNEIEKGSSRKF